MLRTHFTHTRSDICVIGTWEQLWGHTFLGHPAQTLNRAMHHPSVWHLEYDHHILIIKWGNMCISLHNTLTRSKNFLHYKETLMFVVYQYAIKSLLLNTSLIRTFIIHMAWYLGKRATTIYIYSFSEGNSGNVVTCTFLKWELAQTPPFLRFKNAMRPYILVTLRPASEFFFE